MAGRAGRPGKDTRGEAITLAKTEAEKEAIYEEFITADVEEIYSKLAVEPVLRMYVLSLIATEHVRTKKQIIDFFSKTFWAFQYKDMQKLEAIINKMLGLLEEFAFIESNKGEFTTAIDYANESYIATAVGKRVAELYLDPLTAHALIEGMKCAKTFSTFSLLQLMCSQLELRPLLNVRKSEYEDIEQQLILHTEELLTDAPTAYDSDYDEFLKSIKTTLFFETWIQEATEEELLLKFDVRPGELYAKKERLDWLIYAAAELAKLLQSRTVEKELQKLRIRVEQGVKEELFTLLKFEGIGRVRARKLYDNKIKDTGDIKKADMITLTSILGPSLTVSLKKQVGIDVEKLPVKENKRKGQISLMDY
jgi:helicase